MGVSGGLPLEISGIFLKSAAQGERLPMDLSSHQCIFCEKLAVKDDAAKLNDLKGSRLRKTEKIHGSKLNHKLKKLVRDRLDRLVKHACMPSAAHEKALVFVLENRLSQQYEVLLLTCSACSMPKNCLAMRIRTINLRNC